jgi:hypothetical protein
MTMKYLFAIIVSALALVAAGYEAMWLAEHSGRGGAMTSPDGRYTAKFFSLPEGAAVPYGSGVYVRYRYLPLWSTSTLVFGGYCDRDSRLYWRGSRELVVACKPTEGMPKRFPAPDNIVVTHLDG